MKKKVLVVFADHPFGTNRFSERLRMTLGLTINDDNQVNLLFLGNARYALQELDEAAIGMKPIAKHLDMLGKMKAVFHVEEGGDFSYQRGLELNRINRSGVDAFMDTADVIIN